MLMGVYMVDTEAVVTGTTGTVAELKVRMGGIGAPAYLAAAGVVLGLLLILDSLHLALEVNRGLALAASAGADVAEKLVAAEKQEVEHGHNGEKVYGEGQTDNIDNENNCVYNCQPLHLYGDYKEEENLKVGKEGGKGEEH